MEDAVLAPLTEDLDPTKIKTLDSLRQSNEARLRALASQGIQISPASAAMIRLNVFIQAALAPDDLLDFEIMFESAMADAIAGAQKELRQQQIVQGVAPASASGLILPR